jgi:flavin reductase (DIM6/NTAB) family NADH-FMN oxidoreductase RutF
MMRTVADPAALDAGALRKAFACFPSGVTALCAMLDESPLGMAASSFTSVSLDPPLVSVCVANTSATWAQLRDSHCLGVSVLGADHEGVCRQLAAKDGDRFAGVAWRSTLEGAVFIDGAPLVLDCSLEDELPAGDHHIALLRIHGAEVEADVAPLVFHQSRFRQLL